MFERSSFKDSVAFVTGSSRGIGLEIAKELAAHGAHVILNCDKVIAEGEQALIEVRKDSPGSVLIIGDVGVPMDVHRMAEEIDAKFGRLDILINNAGIVRDALLVNTTDTQWEDVIRTNLTSVFLMSKECLPLLRKSNAPRMVNISSVVALMGNVGQSNYSASKGGILSITKTLARELARDGILVNAIAPGFISTRMTQGIPEKVMDGIISTIPMRRLGTPAEVANLALFLASSGNTYITGQIIGVNGGLY